MMILIVYTVFSVVGVHCFVVKMLKSVSVQKVNNFASVNVVEHIWVTCQHKQRSFEVVTHNGVLILIIVTKSWWAEL